MDMPPKVQAIPRVLLSEAPPSNGPLRLSGVMSQHFYRNDFKSVIFRDEGTEVYVNRNTFNVSLCYEM
jgi:hypothetical protein